jgi:outer membrane protein insertion porin family
MAKPPAGRVWRRRAIGLVALILVILVGGGLFLASPRGKAFVLRSAASSLRGRLGLEARAAALDYRLGSLGVTLHGVTVTQSGARRPFITAQRVAVDFSAAILGGRFALRRLEVTRPEIRLDPATRVAPAAGRKPAATRTFPSFDIGRLDLRDLTLTIGSAAPTLVTVRGLSLALAGEGPERLRGEVVVSGGVSVQQSEASIRFDRMRADISLAGTSLSLTSIRTESPVATAGASATLDVSRGEFDVKYDARLNLDQLSQWWTRAPPVGGAIEASGTVGGTLDQPAATFVAHGERLRWRGVTDATLSASGRWSGGDLVIDQYALSSNDSSAHLSGRARLALAGVGGSSTLRVQARADDPRRLALLTRAPAPPRVPLTLVAEITWPGPLPAGATLGGNLQIAALDVGSPGAALATVDAKGQAGRWTVRQRAALPGHTTINAEVLVVVDPDTVSRSTLDGRATAQSADLATALGDLRRRGFSWANVEALRGGRAAADAVLTGTLASPRLQANVTADSVALAGIDQVRTEAQVRVDGRSIQISRMIAEASGNRIEAQGLATIGGGPIDITVAGRFENPDILAGSLPAHWRPTGSLVLSGKVDGSPSEPRLAGRLSGSRLEANGMVVDTLDGGVTFERGVLRVTELRLNRGDGWLRLDADFDRSLGHMKIRGKGEKLALSVRHLRDAGTPSVAAASPPEALHLDDLSLEFDIAGPPARPEGTIAAAVGELAFEGQAVGPVTLSAEGSDGTVRFDLELPNYRADVTGSIGLAHAWPFEAHANLRKSELAALVPMLGPTAASFDTTGTVTGSAEIAGRLDRPLDSSGALTLLELDGLLQGRPLTLVQRGRVRFDGRRTTVEEPLRLTLGGFSIGLASPLSGRGSPGVMATLEGRIEDGFAFLPPNLTVAPWLVEGPIRAQISLSHDGDRVAIAGNTDVTLDRVMRGDREFARDLRMRAQIRGGAIEASETAGTVLGGPFSGTLRVPIAWALPAWLANQVATGAEASPVDATMSARADVALTDALKALAITRDDVSGSAKIAIDARATAPRLENVEAKLDMEAGELSINRVNLAQQVPTRLRFTQGRLEVTELSWKGPRSAITASGALGVLAGAEGEFRAEGTTALAFLRTIVPGATGEAAFRVSLAGPPGSRRASANVDLNDVSLIAPQRQLALAGLSGTLTLEADVLETRGLRGQLNGGEFTVEGTVPVRAGVVAPRPLTLEGRGLFVEIPRGLRSQLDVSLAWENAPAGPRLSGQVSIASDTYREPVTALAALAASLSSVAPAPARTIPPWIAATALDIHLNSVGPLVVDQSMLKVELVPEVQLSGTVGRPALSGQVAIQDDGRIQAGGRNYRLLDSRLEFSPAGGLLPQLNVIGETRVSSYLVTLRITGPANEIETNFSSDPPLSERDVRSLLVTGQTADPGRGSTDSEQFAIGAVSGDVLGIAGQFVGIDSVRVGTEDLDLVSADVNPNTRLTVSKRLGSRFELVLSEDLEDSQSTWIVIYRPVTGYEFRLSSEDTTRQAFEFRQEITFGPGVSPHARVRSVTVVRDRVRSVTLAGDAGFPADQVLAGTKIRAGDRFDFRQWLDDRDRIARFYRDRGYFTARIVPMRTAGEATGKERRVDLLYRITRGSRTLLEVTGYSADDEFIGRLVQTWSDNVLPDLLGESLARTARNHLIDDGLLRARVEVDTDAQDPGTTRARIRIDPGPRSDSRRVALSGNRVISSEVLQDLASSRRLDAEAWKDPAPLIDEIRAAYAAKGYLGARARAEPIEFSNGSATLPITIEEGPPAHVASLDLTGVAPERRAGALDAIALPVGSAFAAGMGRAGRTRLERHYRDLGFRDVRVEVSATSAPQGPAVGLAFAVHEGPLHVVRSVEIDGVRTTRASLVNGAVDLAPGEPAGAAAAAATERRLYDLGTFRRAELRFEPDPAPAQVPGTVPVKAIVSLEEARRFQLRYGVELSSEYSSALAQRTNALGVAADIRDRNFLGRGMSLGGGLRYEPDLRSARSLFSVPKLVGLPIRTNVHLTVRAEEETTAAQVRVRDDETEIAIEQRLRVGRAVEYSWGFRTNWRDAGLTPATRDEPLVFDGILASLNGAAVVDRRDSFFDAKRGWFGSVSTQWGQQAFGSDLDYLRTLVRGSYYQPVGPVVLAGNVRWGRLLPLGGRPPLTVFDLFFNAGGTETVRGYAQDELSAYEFFGAPLGGTKLLVVNAELRAPLFWRFGGVLFADAGNTFGESQPMRFRDLGVGLGVGLRINTPLAPVRIDLGYPRRFEESGFRWHFSIGQMF